MGVARMKREEARNGTGVRRECNAEEARMERVKLFKPVNKTP